MLLNLEQDTLRISVVGHAVKPYEAKLENIPKNMKGWVPHFNTNEANQTLQIAKIPIDWYGEHKQDLFEFDY